jgi:hypothetical protein
MNTNDLTVFLVSIAAFSIAFTVIAYYTLRLSGEVEKAGHQPARSHRVAPQVISRRRATSFPGIICALPMHQVKRADAPMTDIWSK